MHALRTYSLNTSHGRPIDILQFGCVDYGVAQAKMTNFATSREDSAHDQIWILEHPSVYTQGTACEQTTLLPSAIPVIKTDRGGQITFHGKGQLVMYPLLKLKNHRLGVKQLVTALEQTVINILAEFALVGSRRVDAPGVYVADAKIAALGLRIRRGTSYHGLSFNINMDLQPFDNIDPCGYEGLRVTQLANLASGCEIESIRTKLPEHFVQLI